MTDLVLIGASGLAREVVAGLAGRRRILGVLDDDASRHGASVAGHRVLGGSHLAATLPAELLITVGAGSARRGIVERLRARGVDDDRFAAFVSPAAHVAEGTVIGPGSILLAGVVVTTDVTIGSHVVVMPNSTLTHDNAIGDFVTIAAGVSLGGWVTLATASYIGMNASVRQRVAVGAGATVGMGSAVLHDVPDGQTWAGVPARRLHRSQRSTPAVSAVASAVNP
jgi:sugar O-acyltransferase (sialic acid O-acetyltransferase NeuD family)